MRVCLISVKALVLNVMTWTLRIVAGAADRAAIVLLTVLLSG